MSHDSGKIIQNMSVNCVLFGFRNQKLNILLIKRANEPLKGEWALPGGFFLLNENPDEASQRVLEETTGVKNTYMEQVAIFGSIDRFPNKHVFSVAYFALAKPEYLNICTGIDTDEVKWCSIDNLPKLVFDHNKIYEHCLEKLKHKIVTEPVIFDLLEKKFTIPQVQNLYEEILNHKFDRRNFRKRIVKNHYIIDLNEKDQNNLKRPAKLYSFNFKEYEELTKKGFRFSF